MQLTGKIVDINYDKIKDKTMLLLSVNQMEAAFTGYKKLKDKNDLEIEIKSHQHRRSKDANSYFHVLCNKLARHFEISDEEMKVKMVLQYGTLAKTDKKIAGAKIPKSTDILHFYPYAKWIGEIEENGVMFDKYLFYERTHLLDSAQMYKLIQGVIYECKEVGIETLTPKELKEMIDEWENNRK